MPSKNSVTSVAILNGAKVGTKTKKNTQGTQPTFPANIQTLNIMFWYIMQIMKRPDLNSVYPVYCGWQGFVGLCCSSDTPHGSSVLFMAADKYSLKVSGHYTRYSNEWTLPRLVVDNFLTGYVYKTCLVCYSASICHLMGMYLPVQ